jgi:hypothetical protein
MSGGQQAPRDGQAAHAGADDKNVHFLSKPKYLQFEDTSI